MVHSIRNFTGVPNAVVCPNCFQSPFHKVSVLNLPKLTPCFNLTQPWDGKTRSSKYLYERFCGAVSVSHIICKLADTSLCLSILLVCNNLMCEPWFSSVKFSRSVGSDSLQPHESQHARPPCPSPTPRVHSNSRPSSR